MKFKNKTGFFFNEEARESQVFRLGGNLKKDLTLRFEYGILKLPCRRETY